MLPPRPATTAQIIRNRRKRVSVICSACVIHTAAGRVGGPLALARDLTSLCVCALQKRMVCYFYWDLCYDELGQLIRDDQEEISNIVWRNDGKIARIERSGSTAKTIEFGYNPSGERISKKFSPVLSCKKQRIVRDAQV